MKNTREPSKWIARSVWIGLSLFVFAALLRVFVFYPNRESMPVNPIKCASNLRQIGQGILLYSNEHGGLCPLDLATLLETEEMVPETFLCPMSSNSVAKGDTAQALATDFRSGKHCSYVYLGAGCKLADIPIDAILVYEAMGDHDRDGANVLFGDGHVEWMQRAWMNPFEQKVAAAGPSPKPMRFVMDEPLATRP